MKARDVMVSPVITVKPGSTVREAAKIFLEHRISAVPVVDAQGNLAGIVSEGDLLHRVEAGTERKSFSWLRILLGEEALAAEFTKAHATKVGDLMTRNVITATPETPLSEIAALLEKHAIKRVPIVRDGKLVGIVSRANLIQAVASAREGLAIQPADATIRDRILTQLKQQPWAHTAQINITVNGGVVDLWGITYSDSERNAIRVAAEGIAGVRAVNDHLITPPMTGPAF